MLFAWLKRRRRRNILIEPFPPAWLAILHANVRLYELLPAAEQKRLRDSVQILIAEREWEGCRGLDVTDEIRVTVAALASVLILGFDDFYFDNVQSILVYPDAFVVKAEHALGGGATIEEESDRLGEAHQHGPVLIAWAEVLGNARHPGHGLNLVYHEFAHQLDMRNGAFDGTPDLSSESLCQRWAKIMDVEYRRLQRAERRGLRTLLDPYGATDPAEFFAVTTECFFDAPRAMREEYPELYALFRDYYRQDPAAWPDFENA